MLSRWVTSQSNQRAQKLTHKYGPGGSYTLADGSNKLSDFINGSHWCHLTFVNDSGQSGPPPI